MQISLPYGTGALALDAPDGWRVLRPKLTAPQEPGGDIVRRAMAAPIGCKPLWELAAGKKDVVVIVSDHTRPVPSRDILPEMLRQIRQGAPDARVRLLVATGCHRATTREELRRKLGDEIFAREEILVHDCDDPTLVDLGALPSGQPLRIARAAAEADLLVAEGFIEPHFFAGFSGGRKSVLPGIAARATVVGNHCAAFIDSPNARTGVLGDNPIHRDMVWAAQRAGLSYIVNVVVDPAHRVAAAFAGDPVAAHAAGCRFVAERATVSAPLADVVITTNGGHPLDQNLYQAVKGMTAAEALVKPGGVIVMLASCRDGIGGEWFRRQISGVTDIDARLAEFLRRAPADTEPDQWQSQIFLRVRRRAREIVMVCGLPDAEIAEMGMTPAPGATPQEKLDAAVRRALAAVPGTPAVTVVPDGVSVIARGE